MNRYAGEQDPASAVETRSFLQYPDRVWRSRRGMAGPAQSSEAAARQRARGAPVRCAQNARPKAGRSRGCTSCSPTDGQGRNRTADTRIFRPCNRLAALGALGEGSVQLGALCGGRVPRVPLLVPLRSATPRPSPQGIATLKNGCTIAFTWSRVSGSSKASLAAAATSIPDGRLESVVTFTPACVVLSSPA